MLKINIKVIPRAKRNEVQEKDGQLICRVTAAPEDGQANEMVIKLLSEYLGVPKSTIQIVRGSASRRKLISIN